MSVLWVNNNVPLALKKIHRFGHEEYVLTGYLQRNLHTFHSSLISCDTFIVTAVHQTGIHYHQLTTFQKLVLARSEPQIAVIFPPSVKWCGGACDGTL